MNTSAKKTMPKPVAPEDNWALVANPDVYLDVLP
jgi:hypothetical protein